MRSTVSVIVPTLGRETLTRTLESCRGADEIIVVADGMRGDRERAWEITNSAAPHATFLTTSIAPLYDVGYYQREIGQNVATSTHLAYMDDDDVYVEGAFDLIREHATNVPVIFKMRWVNHDVVWTTPSLEYANVGTPMFIVPNVPDKLGKWKAHVKDTGFGRASGGDFTFIRGCVEKMGGVVWREELIALIRP